jgi:hypothetical protein
VSTARKQWPAALAYSGILILTALISGTGQASAQTPLSCQIGTANYDPILCAQQGGNSVFTPGLPAQVLVSAPSCGPVVPVSVTVRNLNGGPVNDGTPVVIISTIGVVTPSQGTTSAGVVSGVLNTGGAPGVATITATAGAVSGSTTVALQCAEPPVFNNPSLVPFVVPQGMVLQPPPPVPASPSNVQPAPSVSQVAGITGAIRPPATGDGGIAVLRWVD